VTEDRTPKKVWNLKLKEKWPTEIPKSGCEQQIGRMLHNRTKEQGK
jgi:hypothetical protein